MSSLTIKIISCFSFLSGFSDMISNPMFKLFSSDLFEVMVLFLESFLGLSWIIESDNGLSPLLISFELWDANPLLEPLLITNPLLEVVTLSLGLYYIKSVLRGLNFTSVFTIILFSFMVWVTSISSKLSFTSSKVRF